MMKKLLTTVLALTMALSLAACGTPGQAESPSNPPSPDVTASPSQTPELFTFTRENFPRLNGSTSTAPLGRALAAVLLGESADDVADLINFSRTTASFRALMAGESDLLIVGEPNASVYDEMAAAKFEASIDTFANDGLVFVVNANNPVDSLTLEQLQGIYTGKITNWKEVGGEDLEIVPFQRNEDAGSQALMKKLVMGDLELMAPPEGYMLSEMGTLMEAVRSYDNSASAIGYSVYYYAHDMEMADGLKLLKIDGVAPTTQTIRSGEYPFRNAYYVVMAADTPETSPTAILYNWILSEEGQKLVAKLGYASVLEVN